MAVVVGGVWKCDLLGMQIYSISSQKKKKNSEVLEAVQSGQRGTVNNK